MARLKPCPFKGSCIHQLRYDDGVEIFKTTRDAKEYLVSRIVAEADRAGIQLSDIERKMLYFSETGWTLPDIQRSKRGIRP
jgi:hypothetical protein